MKNIQTGLQGRYRKLNMFFTAIVGGMDPRLAMDGPRILSTMEEHRFPWFLEPGGEGDPMATQSRDGKLIRAHRQTVNPIRAFEWKVPLCYRSARWFR